MHFEPFQISSPIWLGWKPSPPRIKKIRPEAEQWHATWTTLSHQPVASGDIKNNNPVKPGKDEIEKMAKTVTQELIEAKAEIAALKAELNTANNETAKARVSAAMATTKPTAPAGMTQAQAQIQYAALKPDEKKAFRVKNWKILGCKEEI